MERLPRGIYSPEFREQAVRLHEVEGLTVPEVAKRLSLPQETLKNWVYARDLLQRCTSVKTVRLCLQLGRELALPWSSKLDAAQLPTGSDRAWVSRSADGLLLVLKP